MLNTRNSWIKARTGMAGQKKEEKLRGEVSDGSVRAHKCGCCEKGDKAEGTLEGGQVHYGRGEEFMLESQRGFTFTLAARLCMLGHHLA